MKKLRKPYALVLSAMLIASGCGPWSSSNTREVRIAIPGWGNPSGLRTQNIPSEAVKITVKITGGGMAPIEQTIDRSGGTVASGSPSVTPTVSSAASPTATPTAVVPTPTPTPTPVPITVSNVVVSPKSAFVATGNTTTLAATVNLSNATTETTVTWSSSNTAIATVDASGVVTGVAVGTATITATSTRDTTVSGTGTVNVVQPRGTILTTFTGVTSAFDDAVDSSGNVWVLSSAGTVTKFTSSGASQGTFAAGSSPQDIAIDSGGNVWVTNFGTDAVTKLDNNGTPVAGSPFSVAGCGPVGIAIDGTGNAWIACSGSGNIIKLNSAGIMQLNVNKVASTLEDVAVDSTGNVWVTHSAGTDIFKLQNSDAATLANPSLGAAVTPIGVAVDSSDNIWVVLQGTVGQVTKLNNAGTVLAGFPVAVGTTPKFVALDKQGNAWVTNSGSNNVSVVDTNGTAVSGSPFSVSPETGPRGIAIDRNSPNAYVTNSSGSVTKFSTGGPLGILALRPQQIDQNLSPSALPASPGVFDANSTAVVLKFQVPIGDNRLLEATAFGTGDRALVCATTSFNVPASGSVPNVEVNLTALGCQAHASPLP